MRKNKLSLIIVCLLLIVTMLATTSCGLGSIGNRGSNSGDKLEISQEESKAKLQELGEKEGYEIKMTFVDEDGTTGGYTIGVKDNVFWTIQENGDGAYEGCAMVEESAKKYHVYDYQDDAFVFTQTYEEEQDADYFRQIYEIAYSAWLYYGSYLTAALTKGADATVSGRSCYTYTFDFGSSILGGLSKIAGVSDFGYTVYIDKEYGFTAKLVFGGTVDGESGGMSMEITSFKTGNSVVVPTLPDPIPVENNEEE